MIVAAGGLLVGGTVAIIVDSVALGAKLLFFAVQCLLIAGAVALAVRLADRRQSK